MKRSDFLKKLGLCAIIAPIAPKILAETFDKTEKKEDDATTIDFSDRNGELVEVGLLCGGQELSVDGYKRQVVPFKLTMKNNHLFYDMPDTVFSINGSAMINEVFILNKHTGDDWGRVVYGEWQVVNGKFIICWNG